MAGEYGREPCPDRIVDDVGGAFGMGAVGGSAWHFISGMRNSPRGCAVCGGNAGELMQIWLLLRVLDCWTLL